MPPAMHVLLSNQQPTAVLRQNDPVGVGKDSMVPAAVVLSVDMDIGARAVLTGGLAQMVRAQRPRCRAALRNADAIQAGSSCNPSALRLRAMVHPGAMYAPLDSTKQIMVMMFAFCLVLSMPGHCQELLRRTIVFVRAGHTRSRGPKRATVAVVIRESFV